MDMLLFFLTIICLFFVFNAIDSFSENEPTEFWRFVFRLFGVVLMGFWVSFAYHFMKIDTTELRLDSMAYLGFVGFITFLTLLILQWIEAKKECKKTTVHQEDVAEQEESTEEVEEVDEGILVTEGVKSDE